VSIYRNISPRRRLFEQLIGCVAGPVNALALTLNRRRTPALFALRAHLSFWWTPARPCVTGMEATRPSQRRAPRRDTCATNWC